MRKAIATVSIGGTLSDKLEAAAAAGFDTIELFDTDLVAAPMSPRRIAERCADLGLAIDLFQPIRDVEGTPPTDFARVLRRVRGKFALMGELGVDRALVCSSCRPDALVDDADLQAEQLAAVADLAAESGITVGYEALAWGRTTSRFHESWDVVRRADRPNLGVVVDTFHMLSRGDGVEALGDVPGDRIAYLQIADAPRLAMHVLEWSRHHRCFPGQGDLDLTPIVASVYERGYAGPLSLEVFSDVVREAPPALTALDAMRSLLHLEEELRLRWGGDRPEAGRERVQLFDPPPAPARADAAFVEVTTGSPTGRCEITRVLSGLGFHCAGQHRSKRVEWWRLGDAHIVLNDEPAAARHGSGRPFASALGVSVPSPATLSTRAEELLWPGQRALRGVGETQLPGLGTPTGLTLFFSGHRDSADHWQHDFQPLSAGTGPTLWDPIDDAQARIDHVATTMGPVLLPAELSFFRTVLGLGVGGRTEWAHPSGRLHSRALRPRAGEGDLHLVVDVDEGSHRQPAPRGFTQIAIAVPDVVAAVRRARFDGVRLLQVPDNYYVDLAGREELDQARIDLLRAHGVLYDSNEDGELLHAFTDVIGGAFTIQLVQRIGGYAGYGEANTHVRLMAQAAQLGTARRSTRLAG